MRDLDRYNSNQPHKYCLVVRQYKDRPRMINQITKWEQKECMFGHLMCKVWSQPTISGGSWLISLGEPK